MKILLIRFSSIGDIVLTTPVSRCLKRQLNAEIHFLTKKQHAGILSANPYIDRIISLENNLSELLPQLRAERYDQVIDLHHNLRSFYLKIALGRPTRAFNKLNLLKWLLVRTGLNLLPKAHIVDRYLETVRHLGVHNDGQGLDHFIPPEAACNPADLCPGLGEHPYIAFAIGATHATKRLPEGKLLEICRRIPMPIVLLGGPSEQAAGRRLAEQAGNHIFNLCGRLSIHQSADMIRRSTVLLTHDTGMMHIGAALRKPIVSIWGSTVPAFGMYPYYPEGNDANMSVEVNGLSCRPCSKIGFDRCPKGHFKCMNDQNVEALVELLV